MNRPLGPMCSENGILGYWNDEIDEIIKATIMTERETEVPEILRRALARPITLAFQDPRDARAWKARAWNHIRRKDESLRILMISVRGCEVRVSCPTPVVTEE